MIYFDHNATTPLSREAREAWLAAAEQFHGNPSSPHRLGARAETALQQARESLARILGCSPLDLVWTSGATESNNMVLYHAARHLPPDVEVWVSAIEHPCVMAATRHHLPKRHRLIPVSARGTIELDWLSSELGAARPGLVIVMSANNETGILQPWREILDLCQSRGVPFFSDAVQWLGKLPAANLGACDFLSGCAHKFGGPKGVGFLKCPAHGRVEPLLRGGPQEEGRRAGTENVAGVMAMVAALQACQRRLDQHEETARLNWRREFERALIERLPGARLVGTGNPDRLWNTVSAVMPETKKKLRWVVKLDKLGFATSTGSACASGKEQPSHVLSAMGLNAPEASRVLRFSSGWETARADWTALLEALEQIPRP